MGSLTSQSTVGEWVADRPRRAEVFERLGIDYCCGGRQSLEAACLSRDVDLDEISRVLLAAGGEAPAPEGDWSRRGLDELCDHIEQTHHAYLRGALPRLAGLADKVAAAHGERHPVYRELAAEYPAFRAELEAHMVKEERVLFPAIRALAAAPGAAPAFHCGDLSAPLRVMESEHEAAGAALRRFRALTDGYRAPADACGTLLALLDGLEALEADLHLHIHKENNLLFPRTRARLHSAQGAASPRD
jgi:regulator of cell morphogenesis and NO signaling